jgi:hypothetical protein
MAFEFQDNFNQYVKRGKNIFFANAIRKDESGASYKYYAFANENGSYVIMRDAFTGSTISFFTYYASKNVDTFLTNWANKDSLTYIEFWNLFQQE